MKMLNIQGVQFFNWYKIVPCINYNSQILTPGLRTVVHSHTLTETQHSIRVIFSIWVQLGHCRTIIRLKRWKWLAHSWIQSINTNETYTGLICKKQSCHFTFHFTLVRRTRFGAVVIVVVYCSLKIPTTCKCFSWTDLLWQSHAMSHWDRSCRSNLLSRPVTVYRYGANQSQH